MNFFDFGSKLLRSTFHSSPIDIPYNGHIELITGNYKNIKFPVIFKQNSGKNLLDILDTGHANLFLISEKLKSVLMENELTGWKTYPIKLFDKKNSTILGYHGFSITGRCGPINYEKSTIIEERLIPTGPLVRFYKGRFFDVKNWDKSDFFLPEETIRITVNKKTSEILKKEKISNLILEPLEAQKTMIVNTSKKYN